MADGQSGHSSGPCCTAANEFFCAIDAANFLRRARNHAESCGSCSRLTFYLRHPLGSASRTAIFFAVFVALYGSLYVLLQSEDHALLLGSLMVFALLAVVMVATRRLDWFALAASLRISPRARPTP